jgi:hypothetical protein
MQAVTGPVSLQDERHDAHPRVVIVAVSPDTSSLPDRRTRSPQMLSRVIFSAVMLEQRVNGNEHIAGLDAYRAAELAASMITAATRSGIESIGT